MLGAREEDKKREMTLKQLQDAVKELMKRGGKLYHRLRDYSADALRCGRRRETRG